MLRGLTHSSYAYENPQKGLGDNEVLEFLGDSVIGLVIADFFFSSYPDRSEGDLSKLKSMAVSTSSLALFAKKINLDKHILLGKGEEKSGGRKKSTILAGALEALLGAVYLDGGLEAAKRCLLRFLEPSIKNIQSPRIHIDNYKSALQEYFQKENLPPPRYKTLMSTGPDHKKTFVVEVYSDQESLARAEGRSKKDAEQHAAQTALKKLFGKRMKVLDSGTFLIKK
jgi:ribonuclease-3